MNLERLAEFERIAACGSVTAAAETLGVSTATLSARLKSFEKEMGIQLFERGGRTLMLTDAGRCLMGNAGEILEKYRMISGDLRAMGEHRYTRLRIALMDTAFPLHLGPLLDKLNLSSADMVLHLTDLEEMPMDQALLNDQVDVCFCHDMDRPVPAGLARRVIAGPHQFAILPAGHPLAGRPSVRLSELSGERFLLYRDTPGSLARSFQIENLQKSGIEYSVYDEGCGNAFLRFLVPVGKGILISPFHTVDLPNAVEIPLTEVPCPACLYLYCAARPVHEDTSWFIRDYFAFAEASTGRRAEWDEERFEGSFSPIRSRKEATQA